MSTLVVRPPRWPVFAVTAALLPRAAASVGMTGGLGLVRAEAAAAGPVEEAWSYPPRIVGRADADVLDVDRIDGAVLLDVAFVGPGRIRTVTRVEATRLSEVSEVGATTEVAFVPYDPEIAFEIDDPGLSDPFDNSF